MQETNTKIPAQLAATEKELLQCLFDDKSPSDWINWLFDIQNTLIGYNHLESFTDKGANEFADEFWTLKNFFQEMNGVKEDE